MILKAEPGLQWAQALFSLVPRWTIEPDIPSINRTIRGLSKGFEQEEVSVSFLTQGALNKIYSVKAGIGLLIMRVSLPVDPQHKTLSEVTTIEWTRRHTSLPVPRIISYDPSQENLIGFEWILMEKIPGKCLADAWRSMEYEVKERLVRQMATYSSELFRNQLRGIGNIYPDSSSPQSGAPPVKRIVSMQFFWGNHLMLEDVPRGPFRSSKAWISAHLSLSEHDCTGVRNRGSDTEDVDTEDVDTEDVDTEDVDTEDAERTLRIIRRLKSHINQFFPDERGRGEDPEPTMLYHDDLSMHNILVDDNSNLTGVVDWECVSALPLWKACYYPFFLQGRPRDDKPDQINYRQEDDGKPNSLYWEHLLEYERTKLRRHFLDEMLRLEPNWINVFHSSTAKRDFYLAAGNCDNEFFARDITEWLDDVSAGRDMVRSLHDRFYES